MEARIGNPNPADAASTSLWRRQIPIPVRSPERLFPAFPRKPGSDRLLARRAKHANQARRLLALAEIYDGSSRSRAAQVGGVGRQIVRDWVERFNARGPEGLIDGKAPGNKPKLSDVQRAELVAIVEKGPTPEVHGVVRWRLADLVQWLEEQFKITLDETNVSRELKRLGYVKLSARPRHHAQDEAALEAFKKGALPPN